MIRTVSIAVLATAMLSVGAYAQQAIPPLGDGSGLEGAPSSSRTSASEAATKKALDKLRADQAKLAQQAAAQKAEQAKLAKQAADLSAQQAKLDAKAAELAAQEKRLSQPRDTGDAAGARASAKASAEQDANLKAQQAKLDAKAVELAAQEKRLERERAALEADRAASKAETVRIREEAKRQDTQRAETPDRTESAEQETAENEAPAIEPLAPPRDYADRGEAGRDDGPGAGRWGYERPGRLDLETARRACTEAAQEEAQERNFYSARYDARPHFYRGRGLELRGAMRLEDRRGYMLVDTVCEVGANGEALRFAFLR